jgi:hypothetical protein
MIIDFNNAATKVANLSTIIVPEFYFYQNAAGVETYTWYDAIPCTEYYKQIYGSMDDLPPSLMEELIPIHNTTWLCPNIPHGDEQYYLQNDPWQYNFGADLNFVVNFCYVSALRKGIVDPNCVTDST